MWFNFLRKPFVEGTEICLEQLEERIVLNASVESTGSFDQHGDDTEQAQQDDPGEGSSGEPEIGQSAAEGPDPLGQIFDQDLRVVLISNALEEIEGISDAAVDGVRVVVYDAQMDDLSTIASTLGDLVDSTGRKIDAIGLVAHAEKGVLEIGADEISLFNLNDYRPAFEDLGSLLAEDAQIQLFGCDLAGNFFGRAVVQSIAVWTSADVFASVDITGGANQDWDLEYGSNSHTAVLDLFDNETLFDLQTELGAEMVADLNQGGAVDGTDLLVVGDNLFFKSDESSPYGFIWGPTYGTEPPYDLWMYNPALGGVRIDTNPFGDDDPLYLGAAGDNLFVRAFDGNGDYQLWMIDATGTKINLDTNPAGWDFINEWAAVGDNFFCSAYDGTTGDQELLMVDASGVKTKIDTNPSGSDVPSNLTALGDKLFVSAHDESGNSELWMVDSAGAKTRIDTNPSGADVATPLAVLNDKLFVSAYDDSGNKDLWMVDSTGTKTHIDTNSLGSDNPNYLATAGTNVFFTADSDSGTNDLWMVDSSGSKTCVDIYSGSRDRIYDFIAGESNLFVFAGTGSSPYELWMIDATGAKTHIDTNSSGEDYFFGGGIGVEQWATVGDSLVVFAYDDALSGELWFVDSTGAKSRIDTNPAGHDFRAPYDYCELIKVVGDNVFVYATVPGSLMDLWMIDSTGTASQIDTCPSGEDFVYYCDEYGRWTAVGDSLLVRTDYPAGSNELCLVDATGAKTYVNTNTSGHDVDILMSTWVVNDHAFVWACNDSYDTDLWMVDSTGAKTHIDINPTGKDFFNFSPFNPDFAVHWADDGTNLFVRAYDGGDWRIWSVDPTGVASRIEVYTGPSESSDPYQVVLVSETAFFDAYDGTSRDLWMHSPSTGAVRIDTNQNGSDDCWIMVAVGDKLFVQALDDAGNSEIWMVDTAGTKTRIDTNPSGKDSARFMRVVDDKLFADAYDENGYRELWMFDTSGTKTKIDTNPAGADNPGYYSKVLAGYLYIEAYDANGHKDLWRIDSTGAKTRIDTNPSGSDGASVNSLTSVGSNVFLSSKDDSGNVDLWMVDSAGALTKIDTNPLGSDYPSGLTAVGDKLFVKARDETGVYDLWMVSTTGALTRIDTNPSGGDNPENFTIVGSNLFVTALDETGVRDLWMVSSTGALTRIDTNPAGNDNPTHMLAGDSILFVTAQDETGFTDLWMVDATGAKTKIDTNPSGNDFSTYAHWVTLGDHLLVRAYDGSGTPELWLVDPTGTKTKMDTNPSGSDDPTHFYAAGGRFFVASLADGGENELWMIDTAGSKTRLDTNPSGSDNPLGVGTMENGVLVGQSVNGDGYTHFWRFDVTGAKKDYNINPFGSDYLGAGDQGGDLYYTSAWNNLVGRELWRIETGEAPVLNSNGSFTAVVEDVLDADNVGTSVGDILSGTWSDADGDDAGIVLTGLEDSLGHWEFKIPTAGAWEDLSALAPTESSAILLGPDALIRFVPDADEHGSAQISYYVWDQAVGEEGHRVNVSDPANRGGFSAFSLDAGVATIIITAQNDAPVNTVPADQLTNEDIPLIFTGGNKISVSDVDIERGEGIDQVQVTLTASNGTLTIGAATDTSITISGTLAEVNTALDGMELTPDPGFFGLATIEVVTSDLGNFGAGGALTDTDTVNIDVVGNTPNLGFETDGGGYMGWALFKDARSQYWATFGIGSDGSTIGPWDQATDHLSGLDVPQSTPGTFGGYTFSAEEGSSLAFLWQNGPSHMTMYHVLQLGSDPDTLTWSMEYTNHLGTFSPDQQLRIYLTDTSNTQLGADLFITDPGDPAHVDMTGFSADISPFADQTVRLWVDLNVQGFYFDVVLDNLSVNNAVQGSSMAAPAMVSSFMSAPAATSAFDAESEDPLFTTTAVPDSGVTVTQSGTESPLESSYATETGYEDSGLTATTSENTSADSAPSVSAEPATTDTSSDASGSPEPGTGESGVPDPLAQFQQSDDALSLVAGNSVIGSTETLEVAEHPLQRPLDSEPASIPVAVVFNLGEIDAWRILSSDPGSLPRAMDYGNSGQGSTCLSETVAALFDVDSMKITEMIT